MPPPSPLAIATGAVNRLVKEDASYRKELVEQEEWAKILEERIKSGQEDEDGNAEFLLKQQKQVVEQTRGVFEPLRKRIEDAVAKLEDLVASEEKAGGAPPAELENAKAALEKAKTS